MAGFRLWSRSDYTPVYLLAFVPEEGSALDVAPDLFDGPAAGLDHDGALAGAPAACGRGQAAAPQRT
jgi:hypothetical protein